MPVEDAIGESSRPGTDGLRANPIIDSETLRFCPPPRELLATSEKFGDALVRPAHALLCDYVAYKAGGLATETEIEYLSKVTGLPNSGVRAWCKSPIDICAAADRADRSSKW